MSIHLSHSSIIAASFKFLRQAVQTRDAAQRLRDATVSFSILFSVTLAEHSFGHEECKTVPRRDSLVFPSSFSTLSNSFPLFVSCFLSLSLASRHSVTPSLFKHLSFLRFAPSALCKTPSISILFKLHWIHDKLPPLHFPLLPNSPDTVLCFSSFLLHFLSKPQSIRCFRNLSDFLQTFISSLHCSFICFPPLFFFCCCC